MVGNRESFLDQWDVVNLTHPISKKMPVWPNDPEIQIEQVATIEKDGYNLNRIIIGEHSGTHFGCPAHFLLDARGTEQYEPQELIVPTSVINVEHKVKNNPDYALSVQDLLGWEEEHGYLSSGKLVLLFTNWSNRWDNPQNYLGIDDENVLHFPGFSPEVAEFLVSERGVVGLGIDTHGIDRGCDNRFEANKLLFKANCFHLENLTNLDKLPYTGSILFIGMLPISNSSGSPARVLALVPK